MYAAFVQNASGQWIKLFGSEGTIEHAETHARIQRAMGYKVIVRAI